MKSNLAELRKEAEQAVHDMPEGDLKVKAFETILTHLLSGRAGNTPSPQSGGKGTKAVQSKKKGAALEVPQSVGDRVLFLKSEDFFASQKSIADIRTELKKNGWHYPVTSLSGPLQTLVQRRQLRREKTKGDDGGKGWKYSNP
jgi:hypothetical protein